MRGGWASGATGGRKGSERTVPRPTHPRRFTGSPSAIAIVLAGLTLVGAWGLTVGADTFTVIDETELENAIIAANSNDVDDTILLQGNTITLTTSSLPDIEPDGGNSLTIDGGGGTIDGNDSVRIFVVNSGADLTLRRLTVANGFLSGFNEGAGIRNSGTLTITDSSLMGNSTDGSGGGIYNFQGTVTITNTTITNNSASSGGGTYNFDGTMTIIDSTFTGNSADNDGGGINNENGTMTITNSTVAGNSADDRGGGIYNASTSFGTVMHHE